MTELVDATDESGRPIVRTPPPTKTGAPGNQRVSIPGRVKECPLTPFAWVGETYYILHLGIWNLLSMEMAFMNRSDPSDDL